MNIRNAIITVLRSSQGSMTRSAINSKLSYHGYDRDDVIAELECMVLCGELHKDKVMTKGAYATKYSRVDTVLADVRAVNSRDVKDGGIAPAAKFSKKSIKQIRWTLREILRARVRQMVVAEEICITDYMEQNRGKVNCDDKDEGCVFDYKWCHERILRYRQTSNNNFKMRTDKATGKVYIKKLRPKHEKIKNSS